MQTQVRSLPETVNYHLNKNCNFRCRGCYAAFNDSPVAGAGVMLPRDRMFRVVDAVAGAPLPDGRSARKLTFAGGEPTLCSWLPELISHAKSKGLVTMLGSYDFLEPSPSAISPDLPAFSTLPALV